MPATPLAASMTTLYGRNAETSTQVVQVLDVGGVEVDALDARAGDASPAAPPSAWLRSLSSGIPESPLRGSAPSSTSFMPLYCGGLCEAVTMAPPSSPREATPK